MQYKVKWRAGDDGPLAPEIFDTEDEAKKRARQLIGQYRDRLVMDVWNEDETWQVVTAAGVADWCKI